MKLIIISNRLPVKATEDAGGLKLVPSDGGLATGLDSLRTDLDKHWVGWPGLYIDDESTRGELAGELEKMKFHPVFLTADQIANYYEGYSNDTLWPLCHYFFSYIRYEESYWEAYREVNALFCEKALELIGPDDIVWVQDYQLMLVPGMIRERMPEVSIGYFHHIPFPSYELFRYLPERAEVLRGLLGADLIGFHTHDYMRHFISAAYRVLGLECVFDEIQLTDRVVDVDAFPMGIHYEKYHEAILDPQIAQRAEEFRKSFGQSKLILSVDRLDYSKGILLRLKAWEEFLESRCEAPEKVSLILVVSPSRDTVESYIELKAEIDTKVGAINGRFATVDWTPVYYFYHTFPFDELTALYHIADVALVTPLRDGMNLVAKEYLAAKRDRPGVLILSEMAGAAIELTEALIVNPTHTREVRQALETALSMPVEEQERRLRDMQEIISQQTVARWASDYIFELLAVKRHNLHLREKVVNEQIIREIRKKYDRAKSRLFLLDYDGTLAPFHNDPRKVQPSRRLTMLLKKLAEDEKNKVVISSGRDSGTLDEWLGDLPIGLSAEHGAFYKEEGRWHNNVAEFQWDQEIVHIFEQITYRTPGSRIEIKKTAIVWHYREVDTWLAELRINQLLDALILPASRHNLQIMRGNKIVEIKSGECNKGIEARRIMRQVKYDFVMAIGDDTTDEDMFKVLPKKAFTVKVGKVSDTARFNLPTQAEVLPFLENFTRRPEE